MNKQYGVLSMTSLSFSLPVSDAPECNIPLFLTRCSAGFPSPAGDWIERELDLNEYCVRRKSATFYVRALGDSMTEAGLHSGDLLVVDRAEKPVHGDIVIAEMDGEFTVKRLSLRPRLALEAMNPSYPTIYPDPDTLVIFGVVMHFIHSTRR